MSSVETLDSAVRTRADDRAERLEAKRRTEALSQFRRLKDEARAIFAMVDGRPGVKSLAEWQKLLERAGDEIGNGRFLVRCLGVNSLPIATPFSLPIATPVRWPDWACPTSG